MDGKKVFARNLNAQLEKAGKSRKDVCDALGLNYYTFADWCQGRKYPRMDKVEMLANYFGILKSDLIEDKPTAPQIPDNVLLFDQICKTRKVPLIGTIACGRPILAVEDATEAIDVPDYINADFALRCKGDSMVNARIFDGDIVYIKSQPAVDNGQIAAVIIDDEATLKRVYYQPGKSLTLRPCNPLYPDLEFFGSDLDRIKILGKAVFFVSAVRD